MEFLLDKITKADLVLTRADLGFGWKISFCAYCAECFCIVQDAYKLNMNAVEKWKKVKNILMGDWNDRKSS